MARQGWWRKYAIRYSTIALEEWRALDEEDRTPQRLNDILRERYPFGERKYYPYKVWLSERRKRIEEAFPKDEPLHTLPLFEYMKDDE